MGYTARSPIAGDADALGRVHVRAWQAAYRGGLMPDEYLDGLSADERAAMWRDALNGRARERTARLVACTQVQEVVGFALVGPAGGEPDAEHGELYAINVDPDHWGLGPGPLLLAAALDALQTNGFRRAVLWVHPDNLRARAFYERNRWVCDEVTRTQEVLGVTVPEIRYSIEL